MCVSYISFCCRCSHDGLLLTVGAEPGHHLGLVDAGLDQLDLLWMIGKERELSVVVVFFGALDSISSHNPLLSGHKYMPFAIFGHRPEGYLHTAAC